MNTKELVSKSKLLSLILRHNPGKIGIALDNNGWTNVLELCEKMPISKEDLVNIVEKDSKQRYSFSEDKVNIRANQGHSIDVDVELKELEPPEFLFHGTADKSLSLILKLGLKPMSRQYVHLSSDKDIAIAVGLRHGKPIVLKIHSKQMWNLGYKFFKSKNNVWLIKDVPLEYISMY